MSWCIHTERGTAPCRRPHGTICGTAPCRRPHGTVCGTAPCRRPRSTTCVFCPCHRLRGTPCVVFLCQRLRDTVDISSPIASFVLLSRDIEFAPADVSALSRLARAQVPCPPKRDRLCDIRRCLRSAVGPAAALATRQMTRTRSRLLPGVRR